MVDRLVGRVRKGEEMEIGIEQEIVHSIRVVRMTESKAGTAIVITSLPELLLETVQALMSGKKIKIGDKGYRLAREKDKDDLPF